jgi:hypothetical protein
LGLVQVQEQPLQAQEQQPPLSYRRQPEQQRQQQLPGRGTCSFEGSLMNEKHFPELPKKIEPGDSNFC